jgi:TonB family protein
MQQSSLSDLRTLAAGFHDLSVKAIPPTAPPAPPAPPVAPVPSAPDNLAPRIYSGEDAGVRPPATIQQELPRYAAPVPPGGLKGVIEVVIDESGRVTSSTMIVPVGTSYDNILLQAANKWRFLPATINSAAVKFRKQIHINIAPPTR